MSRGEADFPHADELAAPPASESGSGPRAPIGGTADDADLARVPPLGMLATGAAVVHLLVHRVLLALLGGRSVNPPTSLLVAAPFAMNLAVAAALVAFVAGSTSLVRAPQLDSTRRRLLISGLSALLSSTVALALLAPEGHLTPQHVLAATAGTHMLVFQLCIAAAVGTRSRAGRTAVGLVAFTSAMAVGTILLRHLTGEGGDGSAVHTLHGLGELAFLLVPTASAFAVLPWDETPGARRARRIGFVAVCVMAMLITLAARLPGQTFALLLFSTLKLEWALERASLGYALPLSLAVGAATAALAGPERRHRQGGAGLWLWLCAGYNPLTPARLLLAALAMLLLSRAILSSPDDAPTPARA
jgi:hypothetical protein